MKKRNPFNLKKIQSLAITGIAALLMPITSFTTDLTIENTLTGKKGIPITTERIRYKFVGSINGSFDRNYKTGEVNEFNLCTGGLHINNGITFGGFLEGETNTNGEEPCVDFGISATGRIGSNNYTATAFSIVQRGEFPEHGYQIAVKDTSGNKNLTFSLFDDKANSFGIKNLDIRINGSVKIRDFFGGIGINQEGIFNDPARVYGSLGILNRNFGTITAFDHNPDGNKTVLKMQNAFGNPSNSSYNISISDIWNSMKGPGMRDVCTPYFSSFLMKGDHSSLIEFNVEPKKQDYQFMVGENLGIARVGVGINYHLENGKTNYGELIHVAKDFGKKDLRAYLEARYNTREKDLKVFGRVNMKVGKNN